ncbi:MAG: energy transducer TonB [Methylovirgula sp.]
MASDPPSRETEIVHVDPSERVSAPAASGPASAKQRGRSAAILIGAFAAHLCLVLELNRLDATPATVAQQTREIPIELVTEPPPDPTKKADHKKTGKSSSAAAASAKPGPTKKPATPESTAAAKSQPKPEAEAKLEAKPQTPPAAKPKQEAKLPPKPEAKPPPEPSPKSVAEAPAKPVANTPPETPPKPVQKTLAEPSKPPAPAPSPPKPAVEAKLPVAPKPAEEKKPPQSPAKAAEAKPPEPPPMPKLPELARLPTGLDPLLNPPVPPAAARPAQQAGLPPALAHLPPMSETFQAVAVPAPTQDGDLITAYKTLVFSKLELAKRFPESARKRHAHGSAIIAFALDDEGHVKRVTLIRSSGDTALDVASLALVERAAPFPPPPPGAQKEFAAVVEFDDGK